MTSVKYSVNINLDSTTLAALQNGKYQMQVYKGVKSSGPAGALPTVWFSVNEFSNQVNVSWKEEFGGYFSDTKTRSGVKVNISTHDAMGPGDIITLAADGSASVASGGPAGEFSFDSKQTTEWTSGLLSKDQNGKYAPICAFPQFGAVGNIMEPYEKVLILFTQAQLDTGAVVETAISASVSVILSTSVPTASLDFSINSGWNTNNNPQASTNPANFQLAPELIIPSATAYNIQKELKLRKRAEAERVLASL